MNLVSVQIDLAPLDFLEDAVAATFAQLRQKAAQAGTPAS
jgi:hypothetical protein